MRMKSIQIAMISALWMSFTARGLAEYSVNQNWDNDERAAYWYTPQGSYLVPYDWFLKLRTSSGKLVRSELKGLGFLDASYRGELNPDGLPIGLTKESEPTGDFPKLKGKGPWLGVTCAACHVGSIAVNGRELIIDGGPAKIDFEKFLLLIEDGLKVAANNPQTVGADKTQLQEVLSDFSQRNTRSFFPMKNRQHPSVNAGPGRTDAFTVILNEVVSMALGVQENAVVASAPVSYPQVWGAPHLQWVQYNGLSNNAFTRNVGEVLGVYGRINLDPTSPRFLDNTVRFENLVTLENLLKTLEPPRWEEVFGSMSAEERSLAAAGEAVFRKNCGGCHIQSTERTVKAAFGGEFQPVNLVFATEFSSDGKRNPAFTATDPWYFGNLQLNWSAASSGKLQGSSVFKAMIARYPDLPAKIQFDGDRLDGGKPVRGALGSRIVETVKAGSVPFGPKENGVRILAETTMAISAKYLAEQGVVIGPNAKYKELTGGVGLERQDKIGAFKARDLRGIWATGPYLHNGSVRTLRDLLRRASEREMYFQVGSSEFDAKDVGFANAGPYRFEANRIGNLAIGHEFGTELPQSDKEALLMYLKSI
jgi:hypothetical protein